MVKTLITTKCELLVSSEDIQIVPGLVYLEFLVGENIDCMKNIIVTDCPDLFRYNLDDDGLYMYYRLGIYTKDYLEGHYEDKLYYDTDTNKIMLGEEEIKTSAQLEAIVEDAETEYSIVEFLAEPIFSICRLSQCLFNYQREFVLEGCSGGTLKCKNNSNAFAREFLFSTVFILRQLIRQQRYEEALRILRSVEKCNGLCKDTKSVTKKCNCGK